MEPHAVPLLPLEDQLLQRLAGVVQAAFDGALGTFQNGRNVLNGALVVVVEHDGGALLVGELVHQLPQNQARVPLAQGILRRGHGWAGIQKVKHSLLLQSELTGVGLHLPLMEGQPDRNATDPGPQGLRVLQLVDGAEHGDEYVLHHLLGLIGLPQDLHGLEIDHAVTGLIQSGKDLLIPRPKPGYRLGVGQIGQKLHMTSSLWNVSVCLCWKRLRRFYPAKILSHFFSIVPSFPGPRQQKQDGPFQGPSCSAVDKVIFSDPASACGPSAC